MPSDPAPATDAPVPPADELGGCPCLHTTPCHDDCTCAKPWMSFGCLRCASYGSRDQQRVRAEFLAKVIDGHPSLRRNLDDAREKFYLTRSALFATEAASTVKRVRAIGEAYRQQAEVPDDPRLVDARLALSALRVQAGLDGYNAGRDPAGALRAVRETLAGYWATDQGER